MTNAESPQQTAILTIDQALQQAIAHHQAGRLQDAELARLTAQAAVLQTARMAYSKALNEILGTNQAH